VEVKCDKCDRVQCARLPPTCWVSIAYEIETPRRAAVSASVTHTSRRAAFNIYTFTPPLTVVALSAILCLFYSSIFEHALSVSFKLLVIASKELINTGCFFSLCTCYERLVWSLSVSAPSVCLYHGF